MSNRLRLQIGPASGAKSPSLWRPAQYPSRLATDQCDTFPLRGAVDALHSQLITPPQLPDRHVPQLLVVEVVVVVAHDRWQHLRAAPEVPEADLPAEQMGVRQGGEHGDTGLRQCLGNAGRLVV